MTDAPDLDRDLRQLEAELRKLEAEYNMYFAGRLPRPPVETRGRVATLVKRLDRAHISNYADRFRFSTLQARYAAFVELWDRGLRAREEGRPGPFASKTPPAATAAERRPERGLLHEAAFTDPSRESDKLHQLYDQLVEARKQAGEETVGFRRFADMVTKQVAQLRQESGGEVKFRVALKNGKVSLTARVSKDSGSGEEE